MAPSPQPAACWPVSSAIQKWALTVKNIEGKLKKEVSRYTSQRDLVPVRELLRITVAPGAITCYLGNYWPAVEALGLVANLQVTKSSPGPQVS